MEGRLHDVMLYSGGSLPSAWMSVTAQAGVKRMPPEWRSAPFCFVAATYQRNEK